MAPIKANSPAKLKFDSSDDHGPISFTVGVGDVIPGWDQGFTGMRVGGKRRLIIPPNLGYGAEGAGNDIPPNAVLIFQLKLVSVKPVDELYKNP